MLNFKPLLSLWSWFKIFTIYTNFDVNIGISSVAVFEKKIF